MFHKRNYDGKIDNIIYYCCPNWSCAGKSVLQSKDACFQRILLFQIMCRIILTHIFYIIIYDNIVYNKNIVVKQKNNNYCCGYRPNRGDNINNNETMITTSDSVNIIE